MDIERLHFHYAKGTNNFSSATVFFSDQNDDGVRIPSTYISEVRKLTEISEADRDLFFILARAIQLKSENTKVIDGVVKKYDFGSPVETFEEIFIPKLIQLTKYVSLGTIANYFNEDAKVEDLDIFLNRMDVHELSLHILDETYGESEEIDEDNLLY